MFLGRLINKTKDTAVPLIARWIANRYQLARLGSITTLKLDSGKQEIFIALDLHGELRPVELTVRYRVLGPTRVEITDVQSSREWVTTFVNEMMPGEKKRLEVPHFVTTALAHYE